MGRLSHDQEQFFYSFRLDEAVSDDHPVREIAAVLDLSWAHSELAPYYSRLGRSRPEAVETGRSTHVAAGSTRNVEYPCVARVDHETRGPMPLPRATGR
jgi:hypothetical protein